MSNIFHRFARLVRHRWAELHLRKNLPASTLKELEQLIANSELGHTGQVRICVEAGLPWSYIWRDATPRQRAISLFGKLRVWDTEHNNGALIYLLLADHAIEIIADRAVARAVAQSTWDALVQEMQQSFQNHAYADGMERTLQRVSGLLAEHFPRDTHSARTPAADELPDAPVVQGRFFKDR